MRVCVCACVRARVRVCMHVQTESCCKLTCCILTLCFIVTALARLNRPPWLDPDPKPSDLEKGWKAIKTVGSLSPIKLQGMHYSTFSATSKAFSLASAATKRSGRRSANSSGDDEEEVR